jgi:hypothetical protein
MKYFVLIDMGYDGISVNQFDNESEARKEYEITLKEVKPSGNGFYEGVALIKGEIIANKNLLENT